MVRPVHSKKAQGFPLNFTPLRAWAKKDHRILKKKTFGFGPGGNPKVFFAEAF